MQLLGLLAQQTGRSEVAADLLSHAIAFESTDPMFYSYLGRIFHSLGRLDDSIAANMRALHLRPNCAQTYFHLALAHHQRGMLKEAAEFYRCALAADPDHADACSNLGTILQAENRLEAAIELYRKSVSIACGAAAFNNLSVALRSLGRLNEAVEAAKEAIAIDSRYALAHNNLGVAYMLQNRFDEAATCWQRALELQPSMGEPHINLAMAWLLQGDYGRGWREYEWRWVAFPLKKPDFKEPQWHGEALDGKTILLYSEQGFGDILQFIRYAPMVAQRGGRIVLHAHDELKRLLSPIKCLSQVVGASEHLPPFDVQIALMSLPMVFGTTLGDVPPPGDCIRADDDLRATWKERIDAAVESVGAHGKLKVGIAWAGRQAHDNDRNRSMTLASFAPVAQVPGVQLFSLQKGEPAQQIRAAPAMMRIIDLTDGLSDFAETAAMVTNLDLIISVDTAVVHVAAAQDLPVWTLLPFAPDWRWLLDRPDTPWYPSMRLFRQTEHEQWRPVIEQVAGQLRQLSGRPSPA